MSIALQVVAGLLVLMTIILSTLACHGLGYGQKKVRWQNTYLTLRDWSLITGRGGGGLQNGKIAGPKLFAPPPLKTG